MKKVYIWGKKSLKKMEIYEGQKKPVIPETGKFAKIHERFLKRKKR